MTTLVDVERFVALAGPRYTWDGVRGCSRPPASYRRALRRWLWDAQGNKCATCGLGDTGEPLEFCHVVARGNLIRGFIPGCVYVGHSGCNAKTKPQHDADGNVVSGVPVLLPGSEHLPYAHLIPTEWPAPTVLRERQKAGYVL